MDNGGSPLLGFAIALRSVDDNDPNGKLLSISKLEGFVERLRSSIPIGFTS